MRTQEWFKPEGEMRALNTYNYMTRVLTHHRLSCNLCSQLCGLPLDHRGRSCNCLTRPDSRLQRTVLMLFCSVLQPHRHIHSKYRLRKSLLLNRIVVEKWAAVIGLSYDVSRVVVDRSCETASVFSLYHPLTDDQLCSLILCVGGICHGV